MGSWVWGGNILDTEAEGLVLSGGLPPYQELQQTSHVQAGMGPQALALQQV